MFREFLFFLIAPILLAIPLDLIVSNKLKKVKEFPCENEVWNDIYSSSINADIAVYGSSRAWVHFDSKIMEDSLNINCYNFGEDASNIMLQYLRHKEYLRFNLRPKLIILSVDMWTLRKIDFYPTYRFYPYIFMNTSVLTSLESNQMNYAKSDFYLPFFRYLKTKASLKLVLDPQKLPYFKGFDKYLELNDKGLLRYKGYRGMDLTWQDESFANIEGYEVNIDSTLIDIMEIFINEVKQGGMELIMVYSPEYKKGQYIVENRNEIMSIFENISSKYRIPFYDYSDSSISKNKEYFYNVQHLNKTGSAIFTQQLVFDMEVQN